MNDDAEEEGIGWPFIDLMVLSMQQIGNPRRDGVMSEADERAYIDAVKKQVRQNMEFQEGDVVDQVFAALMALDLAVVHAPRTIYDRRVAVDARVRDAAPRLFAALRNLTEAVRERPALAESIESATISEAENALLSAIVRDQPTR